VIDFGDLKWVHEFLTEHFDHTLLLDQADPLLHKFEELQALGACKLTLLPDVGCEGAAAFVFENANEWVRKHTDDRVWLESVECRENAKNSGKVTAIKHGVMW
jgi:6-pyruvoyl-tetrahydropterin synthase